jgi:hypothetical protein
MEINVWFHVTEYLTGCCIILIYVLIRWDSSPKAFKREETIRIEVWIADDMRYLGAV